MKRRTTQIIVLVVAALMLFAVFAYQESLAARAEIGSPAPDFNLETLDGRTVRLSDLRGQPVFVNFWTSWCPPCREETPALNTFYDRYNDRITQVGVNWREPADTVRLFLEEFGVEYLVVRDTDGKVAEQYRLGAVPESWFLDAEGVARVYRQGSMTFEAMQAAYEQTTGALIDGDGVGPVPAGGRLLSLAISPDGHYLFAGTDNGLFRSDDAGLSWGRIGADPLLGEEIQKLAWGGPDGRLLFAATDGQGILASADLGATWQSRTQGLPGRDVAGLGFLSSTPALGYAWLSGQGLYRTEDSGETWQAVENGLNLKLPYVTIFEDPRESGGLLAALPTGLFAGSDEGKSWQDTGVREILPDRTDTLAINALVYDPADPERLLLATESGVWISRDGGRSAERPLDVPARQLAGIVRAPDQTDTYYAAAPNGDLYVSRDGGQAWRLIRSE